MGGHCSINFAQHSDAELETSLFYVDRDRLPETHAACLEEMRRRISDAGLNAQRPAKRRIDSKLSTGLSTLFGVGGVGAVFFYGHPAISAVLETAWQLPTSFAQSLASVVPLLH